MVEFDNTFFFEFDYVQVAIFLAENHPPPSRNPNNPMPNPEDPESGRIWDIPWSSSLARRSKLLVEAIIACR